MRIPYSVTGAFGAYCGFTLAESKACIRRAFDEFNAIEDPRQADPISQFLFDSTSVESQQLLDFGSSITSELHCYPEAFMEVQERAFAGMIERSTEAEHVGVKVASHRTLRFTGPAIACARKRHGQVERMPDDPQQRDWVAQTWMSKTMWFDLLGHMFIKPALGRMSNAEKTSYVYAYDKTAQFPKSSQIQAASTILDKCREDVAAKPAAITKTMSLCVTYFKAYFVIGDYFSVPEDAFALAMDEPWLAPPAEILPKEGFDVFTPHGIMPSLVPDGRVFFSIVDAHPESKSQTRLAHVVRSRSMARVQQLKVMSSSAANATLQVGDAPQVNLDLANWCSYARFRYVVAGANEN